MTLVRPTKETTAIFGTTTRSLGSLTIAYNSYVRYCGHIGQTPQSQADWEATCDKAKANIQGPKDTQARVAYF